MKKNFNIVETIDQLHQFIGFEKPQNPLITVIDYSNVDLAIVPDSCSFKCSFYAINFKKNCSFQYGRQTFDHQEGTMHCTAPEQILAFNRAEGGNPTEGWGVYFHPELIRNTKLGEEINKYSFFSYSENEALHLSDDEKNTLFNILNQIKKEYNTNIDQYTKELIVSNIELLLNYCKRFYNRQFITRSNQNNDIITKFESFLINYFNSDRLKTEGIPTVKYCASEMSLSSNYFSDLLKSETGKNTQEHIHYQLLERAKVLLINNNSSINEIAYELGFQYPQNFSKLFKKKVGISPTMYRAI